MQQCVNLQLEEEDKHEVGDQSAYREALVDFAPGANVAALLSEKRA